MPEIPIIRSVQETEKDRIKPGPFYTVFFNGISAKDLGIDRNIYSVVLSERDDGTSSIKMEFSMSGLDILDDINFKEGTKISISIGNITTGAFSKRNFILTKVMSSFPSITRSKIILMGIDSLVKLSVDEEREYFRNIKDSDVAAEIAKKHGLKFDVEDTITLYPQITQANETDIQFLRRRAMLYGYQVFVLDNTLHFHSPRIKKIDGTLSYKRVGNILEFLSIQEIAHRTSFDIRSSVFDPESGEIINTNSVIGSDFVSEEEITPRNINRFRDATEISNTPVKYIIGSGIEYTGDELRTITESISRASRFSIMLDGRARAAEFIRPNTLINFDSIGKYSGLYFIKEATHTISTSKGYIVDFKARKSVIGRETVTQQTLNTIDTLSGSRLSGIKLPGNVSDKLAQSGEASEMINPSGAVSITNI